MLGFGALMTKYKSIFISDVHLGSKGCKAELLSDFLKENTCENLFLVGDIIDGWRLKRKFFWLQSHTDVIRKLPSNNTAKYIIDELKKKEKQMK